MLGLIRGKKPHTTKRDQCDRAGAAGDDARHVAQRVSLPGQLRDLLPAPRDHHHQLRQDILHHLNVSMNGMRAKCTILYHHYT